MISISGTPISAYSRLMFGHSPTYYTEYLEEINLIHAHTDWYENPRIILTCQSDGHADPPLAGHIMSIGGGLTIAFNM
jgi:hypothetical protein